MTWRGSTDAKDRFFAALVYLLPLFYALPYGEYLFAQFPFLQLIFIPLAPLTIIYSFPFAGLIIFIILFAAVVRNPRISHFIRFNTMQAILLDILLILVNLVTGLLLRGINIGLLTQTLYNLIFLGTLVACIYGIVQSIMGKYAEIPAISEAVYAQVP